MEPAELRVEPGGSASTTVTVRNRGTQVEQFRIGVNGPLASLAQVDPPQLSVFPDDDESAVVTFAVPRAAWPPAGRAPFQVVAQSYVHADVNDWTSGAVLVGRFDQLRGTLEPEMTRGRRPGRHRVSVVNAGNAPLTVNVELTDREGELAYDPPGFTVPLDPGVTEVGEVRVGASVKWFGRVQSLPFTATVSADGVPQPVLLNGVRRQVPRFPWWIPTAAVVAVALVIAVLKLLPQATVPTVGADRTVAAAELVKAGYVVSEILKPDANVAKDVVIGTQPAGGMPLPKGERVQLLVSTGPCVGTCPVKVPVLDGLTEAQARAALTAADFVVPRTVEVQNPLATGMVVSSNPAGGTMQARGSDVVLTVSTGPEVVPTTVPPTPTTGAGAGGAGAAGGAGGAGAPKLPVLKGSLAGAAEKTLKDLGLTVVKTRVPSNAAPLDTVLGSDPPADSAFAKGDTVTLTLAEPTGPFDMLKAAPAAQWSSTNGPPPAIPLTFPGDPGDGNGFALVLPAASLEDGTTAPVLETHPYWQPNGTITGTFTLTRPIIAGDHLRAMVGFLAGSDDAVEFVVSVKGKELKRVPDSATDGKLKAFDADLSAAVGATEVEITVFAGPRGENDLAVWKDLRIEGQIG